MKTFVVETAGKPIIAFRAENECEAMMSVDDQDGGLKMGLLEHLHADGTDLWDGETELRVRLATDEEHATWKQCLDSETGKSADGYAIDPETGIDDPDDFIVFLVPLLPDDDDEDLGEDIDHA